MDRISRLRVAIMSFLFSFSRAASDRLLTDAERSNETRANFHRGRDAA
jgi:hypothetical protein